MSTSGAQGAFLIYQVYGAWIAGQVLVVQRPWETWPLGPDTWLGLAGFAILAGMLIRLVKFVLRRIGRKITAPASA